MIGEIVKLVVDVKPDLKKKIRVYAAQNDMTIKEVIVDAVENYLERPQGKEKKKGKD